MTSTPVVKFALSFYEACDTPRSLTCYLMARYGCWDALVALQPPCMPVLLTDSIDEYRRSVAATDFLRKCQGLPTTTDLESAAVESFYACEAQCAASNVRLQRLRLGGQLEGSDAFVADFLDRAARRVKRILGDLPWHLDPVFSPGASVSENARLATVPDKISNPASSATVLFPRHRILDWMTTAWWRARAELYGDATLPERVRGNEFFTVPKDSTKHRGAAMEPTFNMCYQLAIGRRIRTRLQGVGLDLQLGQATHVRLAREASVSNHLCTIDLSSASDTICRELVRSLLPDPWFDECNALRSHFTRIKGRWVRLEKFSSMGNGFTFELETLLFLCLAWEWMRLNGHDVVIGENLTVYGDDIIMPSALGEGFLSVLRFVGLTPNTKKTFLFGGFRESCGGDFFEGVSVRAHFLKEIPHEPHHWISLANGIRRLGSTDSGCFGDDNRYWRPWLRCLDALPSHIRRLRGPSELGDVVIHDDNIVAQDDHNGWRYIRGWVPVTRRIELSHFPWPSVVASALYWQSQRVIETQAISPGPEKFGWETWFRAIADTVQGLGVTPRLPVSGYRVKRIYWG